MSNMSRISSACQRFDDVSDRRLTHCRDDARARTREHTFYQIDCMRTSGVGHVCGLCGSSWWPTSFFFVVGCLTCCVQKSGMGYAGLPLRVRDLSQVRQVAFQNNILQRKIMTNVHDHNGALPAKIDGMLDHAFARTKHIIFTVTVPFLYPCFLALRLSCSYRPTCSV